MVNKRVATVFIDANVFKKAVYSRTRYVEETNPMRWGDIEISVPLSRPTTFNPNDDSPDWLREEAGLLSKVADLVHAGRIRFITSDEVRIEFWGLHDRDGRTFLDGIRVSLVESPLKHSRVVVSAWASAKKLQLDFLDSISSPRFLELKRALGAGRSAAGRRRNQLADLFHVWTADEAKADFLLTLDRRLRDGVRGQRKLGMHTQVVLPSELLAAVPAPSLWWRVRRSIRLAAERLRSKEAEDVFLR